MYNLHKNRLLTANPFRHFRAFLHSFPRKVACFPAISLHNHLQFMQERITFMHFRFLRQAALLSNRDMV
jgi:hypothetical protein